MGFLSKITILVNRTQSSDRQSRTHMQLPLQLIDPPAPRLSDGVVGRNAAALAALASSKSVISGVSHLRGHETDRLKALVAEINAVGGKATETSDGMVIEPAELSGGLWRTYEDHRMATAGCIIGLRVKGIQIEDISVTSKTMPGFSRMWLDMLEQKS